MKPLHGYVTVELLEDRAGRKPLESKSKLVNSFFCGKVITVGYEDVTHYINEEGLDIVQKMPFVVKPGDLVLFHPGQCIEWHFQGEVFYAVHQDHIEAVIEED